MGFSPELIAVVISAPVANPMPCPLLSTMDCANTGPKSLFERFLYKKRGASRQGFLCGGSETWNVLSTLHTKLIW